MTKKIPDYVQRRLSKNGFASSIRLLQWMKAEGSVTQRGAAKELGLSYGTCSLHFKKLESLGLIHRVDVQKSEGVPGPSSTIWEISWQENGFLLVFFRASFVEVVLIDFDGNVHFRKKEVVFRLKTGKALLARMNQFVDSANDVSKKIKCVIRYVLVAIPGVVDTKTSTVKTLAKFPVIGEIDFPQWIQSRFNLPVNCVSTGEILYHGEASCFAPEVRIMVVTWDMGIGMVAGTDGQVVTSPDKLFLSEFGHLRVQPNGRLCYCGRKGCLEAYAGGHAILDALNDPAIQTLDELVDAVNTGNPAVLAMVRRAARLIGESLTWVLQVTGTEKLLFVGALGSLLPQFRDELEGGLSSLFSVDEIREMNLSILENSEEVFTRGAFEMAFHCFFSSGA